jgi:hypothetical protein
MKRHWVLSTLALAGMLGAASSVFAQNGTFTSIDYPGSTFTIPWSINGRGDIVGAYSDASGTHGFLLSGGQYTPIDYPGSNDTEIYGINSLGDMSGFYAANGTHHAFVLSGSKFTSIDYPGATSTEFWGINDRGDTVGLYVDDKNVTHGYLLSAGHYTPIDFPGSAAGTPSGVNAQGDVTGTYQAGGVTYGFLLSGGDYTSIGYAGATYTNTTGLNARGDIVGRFTVNGVVHGYLLSGGQYSTFDYPGANFTGLTMVDPRGTILGRYRTASDNQFHGFLLTGFRPGCSAATSTPQIGTVSGTAAVTHSSDFSLVTSSKPATAGEVLVIFAKGLGATLPSVASGQPFPATPLAAVNSLVEVRVNGRSTVVFGAVGLPGAVDGYQVNFRLPADVAKGTAKLELSAGGSAGAPVTIVVQ